MFLATASDHADRLIGRLRFRTEACAAAVLVLGVAAANAELSLVNIGRNPIGTMTTNGPGSYTIVGGGNDIWDNVDEFAFACQEWCGDFDVRVRVESLTPNARWSKAGIMVRESLAEDSRMAFIRVTPPDVPTSSGGNGAFDTFLSYRTGHHLNDASGNGDRFNDDINDGKHEERDAANPLPNPPYPNAWLRLVRQGNWLYASNSADGVDWSFVASQNTATWYEAAEQQGLRRNVLVGLAVSRHSGGPTATAEFRDYAAAAPAFAVGDASTRGSTSIVRVCFTQPVDPTYALNLEYYGLSAPGKSYAFKSARIGPQPTIVDLEINFAISDSLVEGLTNNLSVSGVHSADGKPLTPEPMSIAFVHGEGYEMRPVHLLYNQSPNQWGPDYNGGLVGYYFQTLAYRFGLPVAAVDRPAHTGNATYFEDGPSATPDDDFHECYVARIIGVLEINVDGDYRFACSSDDSGALFLSTDDDPANKVQIAREPQWAGAREWSGPASGEGGRTGCDASNYCENVSAPIHLLAGHKYYLEMVTAEGGGGNHGGVTWDAGTGLLPTNGTPGLAVNPNDPIWAGKGRFIPTRWYRNNVFYNLGPVTISQQPQDSTVRESLTTDFRVRTDGTPPYTYQWRKNGAPISGATNSKYTTPPVTAADDGATFDVIVANNFGSVTSTVAVLTVVISPVILSVSTRGNPNAVYITYSKAVQTDGTYSITQGTNSVSVTGVAYGMNQLEILLTTAALAPDVTNSLTAGNVHGLAGYVLDPNPTTVLFQHGAEYPAFRILYRRFNPNCGFFPCPQFYIPPNQPPTDVRYLSAFEAPSNVGENYTAFLFGFFVAPRTGDYRFWMSSDDIGATYLATDADPAHKVQICAEPAWGQVRAFTDAGHDNNDNRGTPPIYDPVGSGNTAGNGSLPIPLTAGQVVYLEGVFTEGGGGDNYACTVTINDTSVPANGTEPINATNFLSVRIASNGQIFSTLGTVFFSREPVDQTVHLGQTATFSARLDGTPAYSIQWFKDGSPIAGANSADYTTPPVTLADDGAVFSVIVSNAFSSVASSNVMLYVLPNPVVVSCATRGDTNHLYLVFNRAVNLDGAYSISGGITVSGRAYGLSSNEVVLTSSPFAVDASYALTVSNVTEAATGYVVDPNPTMCAFAQALRRFCTDFSNGLPPGTISIGTTPPYVGTNGALLLTDGGGINGANYWTVKLNGLAVFQCFNARWKTYLGPVNAQDGISFNVGRDLGTSFTPEEGATDGLSVTIDTFNNGGAEVGLEIRWNGVRQSFLPVAGGLGASFGGGPPELMLSRFVDTSVEVDATGLATFKYDTLVTTAQLPNYAGIEANMYVFAGRRNENAWIDDVCINDSTLGPVHVVVAPGILTMNEAQTGTFTAVVTGSPCLRYQWSKNGLLIPGATSATYNTPRLDRLDNNAVYSVAVNNEFSSASAGGNVTVIADTTTPTLVSAIRGCINHQWTWVTFSETLDATSAATAGNYTINNGIAVLAATLASDGKTVTLTTSAIETGSTYMLTVTGVKDLSGYNAFNGLVPISLVEPRTAVSSGSGNYTVIVEAEDFDDNFSSSPATINWVFENALRGYSGTGYMIAAPDNGAQVGNGPALSPQVYLDYCVNFPAAGTYYFWVRGATGDSVGQGNSVHIALDGANPDSGSGNRVGNNHNDWSDVCGDARLWGWEHMAAGSGGPASVDVLTPGFHTFRIWMREDGLKVDQFVLTTDATFARAACDGPLLATRRDGPVAPSPLSIRRDAFGFALEWLDPAYRLQYTTELKTPRSATIWSDVQGGSPMRIPLGSGTRFYRLVYP